MINIKTVKKEVYRGYTVVVKKHQRDEVINLLFIDKSEHSTWYFGYVVIPEGNPFYGVDYHPLKSFIHVSGGLSYSGRIDGIGYVLGFNCDHTHSWDDPDIQIEEYTLNECKRLARNLFLLEGLINEINGNNKAEEKTYRYEVYCEIDVKASSGVEARKKLKEEYGSFFHTFIGIVNEDGEVENED